MDQTLHTETPGALGGWKWARFSRYDITNDVVHPAEGAACEFYDPWEEFHGLWARRHRSESRENPGGKLRNARRQQPYHDLLMLTREMEVWTDDDDDVPSGRILGQVKMTPGLRNEVRHWCQHHGLLGLMHQSARELRLPPVWEADSHGRRGQLHAVVHEWKRAGTRWEDVTHHFRGVIEEDLSQEGRPVPNARFPELRPADESQLSSGADVVPRPLLDLTGPGGGLVRESEFAHEGLVLDRFGTYEWASHFPTRPQWALPAWPFPDFHTTDFLRGYGEPLWGIIEAAARLRDVMDLVAYYQPKRSPPTPTQRLRIDAVLADLTSITAGVTQVLELDEEGAIRVTMDSSSLFAAYGHMVMLDLAGGTPIHICQRCKMPFVPPDRRAGYCSDRCRWAAQKAVSRKRKAMTETKRP